MLPLIPLLLALPPAGPPARVVAVGVGDRFTLRLLCHPDEWWSIDGENRSVLARDRLSTFECYFRDRTQVIEFRALRAGRTRLRALRAAGSGPVTGEVEIEVEVEVRVQP